MRDFTILKEFLLTWADVKINTIKTFQNIEPKFQTTGFDVQFGVLNMELQEEISIRAGRDQIFAALNDIIVLKACIPGCEELVWEGKNELAAKVTLKIGPVKARFSGKVILDPSKAPGSFSLSGEGDGGIAGYAKGGAEVELLPDGENTILKYTVKAEIGGKLAQLGGRLILSTSKKLSKTFFEKFEKVMSGEIVLPESV